MDECNPTGILRKNARKSGENALLFAIILRKMGLQTCEDCIPFFAKLHSILRTFTE